MPVFEYECKKCGYVKEFLEKANATAKHTCPQCKNETMKKKLSTFSCGDSSTQSGGTCPTGTCPFS